MENVSPLSKKTNDNRLPLDWIVRSVLLAGQIGTYLLLLYCLPILALAILYAFSTIMTACSFFCLGRMEERKRNRLKKATALFNLLTLYLTAIFLGGCTLFIKSVAALLYGLMGLLVTAIGFLYGHFITAKYTGHSIVFYVDLLVLILLLNYCFLRFF